MKPQWKDAPQWANYLAQDMDGTWTWFSHKPKREAQYNRWNYSQKGGRHLTANQEITDWKDSLEERPANNKKNTYPNK